MRAIATRLLEVEDAANAPVGEAAMLEGTMYELAPSDKATSVRGLIDWYCEKVVERDGANLAEIVAKRKVVKRVVRHLLNDKGRDAQTLYYAVEYDGESVDFEDRLVLLNPSSPYAGL